MNKSAVISTRRDDETLKVLDHIAAKSERTRAWAAAKAIKQYVGKEKAFDAFIQAGLDSIDRGEHYMQEQVEAWFAARCNSAA